MAYPLTIINGGRDYTSNVSIKVRKFILLAKADETIRGKWSVYEWDGNEYIRTQHKVTILTVLELYPLVCGRIQSVYIYKSIDSVSQFMHLKTQIGDIVKINSVGTGGWLLLRKIANPDLQDYTLSYETIGRENGTIAFKNSHMM